MWTVYCIAELEEFAILALLPEWRSDVRGLYWVLRARRRTHAGHAEIHL
jgi:hypothetical protein